MMRTKHLFGAVVLIFATLLGCGKKPEENAEQPPPDTQQPPLNPKSDLALGLPLNSQQPKPPALGEPKYSVPVEDLREEFTNDIKAAMAKYRNTVVEVTGETQTTPADLGKAEYVPTKSRVIGDRWVVCFGAGIGKSLLVCSGRDLAMIGKIFKRQRVRIKGRLTIIEKDGLFPQLKESEVLEIGSDPSVRMTAPELAAAAEKDARTLDDRCDQKSVVLSGTVALAINPESEDPVELKAGTTTRVLCHLGHSRYFYQTGFTAGEQIVFVGSLGLHTSKIPGYVNVTDCIPLNRIPK